MKPSRGHQNPSDQFCCGGPDAESDADVRRARRAPRTYPKLGRRLARMLDCSITPMQSF